MKKIIILNGPNLNLLGEREKNQYGTYTLKDIENVCKEYAKKNKLDLTLFQSNIEGELIDQIQNSRKSQDGSSCLKSSCSTRTTRTSSSRPRLNY